VKSRALNDLRLARLQRLAKRLPEKFPAVLREAIAACPRIVTDRDRFPELGSGRGQRRLLFTERGRERHLLRLEAITLVVQCLLLHCNLVDLRAGRRRRNGGCDPIRTYKPRALPGRPPPPKNPPATIESETGLKRMTLGRALADLRDAGYMTSHQPSELYSDEETGEQKWRGWPAIHTLTLTLFSRLGVNLEWLRQQRDQASERLRIGPEPLEDVRARRELRRVVRSQARAAKRAAIRPTEAQAAAAMRALEARVRRNQP
jgi:hypothetical protein